VTGTFLNLITIILGSLVGLLIGNRLTEKMQESVMMGLGCVTLTIGVQNAMGSGNIILPVLAIAVGAIVGEALDLDGALKRFGGWLQSRVAAMGVSESAADITKADQGRIRFITGFVTASLLFCIGPMAVLGSIQNGIDVNEVRLLAIKSTLDLFASAALASTLGIGVMFSIIPTLLLQGGFSVVGMFIARAAAAGTAATIGLSRTNPYLVELSATGGLVLIALAFILMNMKQSRVANFLPALVIAPLLVGLAALLNIAIYPPPIP